MAGWPQANTTALYARDFLMTDGESASALTRLTDVQRATGRQMMLRLAQFARFRDGKVVEYCSITDTLGVAEQVVGRPLISAAAMRRRWPNSWRSRTGVSCYGLAACAGP